MKRVLVTGASGFIGRNLVRYLRGAGYTVRGFDRRAGFAEDLGDVLDYAAVRSALAGQDAVVHLAAAPGVASSVEEPVHSFRVNAFGSLALLEAAVDMRVPQVLAASTGGAIAGNQEPPTTELTLPAPTSPYGAGKAAMEALLSAYQHSYGMHTAALRFSNVYGPGSEHKPNAVSAFCCALRDGEPLVVYGDGRQVRDYVYVDDVCAGVEAALRLDATGIYQLGSGQPTTLGELIDTLGSAAGRRPAVEHRPARAGEVHSTWVDIARARERLGYRPTVSLEDGLRRTWEAFQR